MERLIGHHVEGRPQQFEASPSLTIADGTTPANLVMNHPLAVLVRLLLGELARRLGIVLREHATRIFAVEPYVTIVVRLEVVCFVDGRLRIIRHLVEGHALERRGFRVASLLPRLDEHEVLDCYELR